LLLIPAAALADNCSSAGDCWGTGAAAAAAAAGAGAAAGAAAAGRGQNGSGRGKKGFTFYLPMGAKGFPGAPRGGLQSFPGAGDHVGTPPVGTRMVYDDTIEYNDQTWYHVNLPGGGSGWLPKSDTWPTRPVAPPPPPPPSNILYTPSGPVRIGPNPHQTGTYNPETGTYESGLGTSSAAQTASARG
jgi:hypothetical protein